MSATSAGVVMAGNGRAARAFDRDDVIQRLAIVLIAAWLVVTVLLPISDTQTSEGGS